MLNSASERELPTPHTHTASSSGLVNNFDWRNLIAVANNLADYGVHNGILVVYICNCSYINLVYLNGNLITNVRDRKSVV